MVKKARIIPVECVVRGYLPAQAGVTTKDRYNLWNRIA